MSDGMTQENKRLPMRKRKIKLPRLSKSVKVSDIRVPGKSFSTEEEYPDPIPVRLIP